MMIAFQFNPRKAIEAMAYLVSRLPGQRTDKAKLMKLLYIAEREHFVQEGRPITGDDLFAMKHGPVPSESLDLLDGQGWNHRGVFDYLQTENYSVRLVALPELHLTESERRVLDEVIARYGVVDTWDLVRQTHRFPEYRQVYREGTSTRIPYELILQFYGGDRLFRDGRAVVTMAMASEMINPFPKSETDL